MGCSSQTLFIPLHCFVIYSFWTIGHSFTKTFYYLILLDYIAFDVCTIEHVCGRPLHVSDQYSKYDSVPICLTATELNL